ncbi:TetR/AcrR family transcriptional regulator [uncultured Agrococcus sp.]|uniref:TetR/AcrR family transcriptional regulator n=1 Tax=uncultured Agrococcus sp. TaxID=382258 RepID=UPI0025E1580F|nr:TetR/AcrR family transcriptional regulator [uncultured Agrococcus sp.]
MVEENASPEEQETQSTHRTRAQQQAETRENLLEAALDIFIERGFHGASIDAIAKHAGYTKGAVYANFKSKDELFLAVADQRINEGTARLQAADDLAHTGDISHDNELLENHEHFESRWAILSLEMILYAIREKPGLITEVAERYQHIDSLTTKFLRRKAADPPESIDYLAIGQSALGEGLMLRHLLEPQRINHDVIGGVFDAVFDPQHREAWKSRDT